MISYVRPSGSSKVSKAVVDLVEPLLILGKKSQREAGRTSNPPPPLPPQLNVWIRHKESRIGVCTIWRRQRRESLGLKLYLEQDYTVTR